MHFYNSPWDKNTIKVTIHFHILARRRTRTDRKLRHRSFFFANSSWMTSFQTILDYQHTHSAMWRSRRSPKMFGFQLITEKSCTDGLIVFRSSGRKRWASWSGGHVEVMFRSWWGHVEVTPEISCWPWRKVNICACRFRYRRENLDGTIIFTLALLAR